MHHDGFNSVPPPAVDVEMSNPCGELFAALSKARGAMQNPERNRENPFFGSRYSDLAAVTEVAAKPLSDNELCVTQWPLAEDGQVGCLTILGHSSGQFIRGRLLLPPAKSDVQGCGSTLTYCRRYTLQAVLGLAADDDDDGNAASQPAAPRATPAASSGPPCPKCKTPMKKRKGKDGEFWGCPKYPKCKGTMDVGAEHMIEGGGEPLKDATGKPVRGEWGHKLQDAILQRCKEQHPDQKPSAALCDDTLAVMTKGVYTSAAEACDNEQTALKAYEEYLMHVGKDKAEHPF